MWKAVNIPMKNLEAVLRKYYKVLLFIILLSAVFVRFWFLPTKNINFIYDQARDAFVVQEIIDGNLKILGPPTSGIPGLYHGVLYYYVITPFYLLGKGNPLIVSYFLAFVNALTTIPVFYFAYLLTKKYATSIAAAILFAFSFDAIQFSKFLSNVSLGILFVPLVFIGLFLWVKNISKYAPVITGLALGLAMQSEVVFGLYLIPIIIWLLFNRKIITWKQILIFTLSFIIAVSTMIVSEVKFGFPGIKGIFDLFAGRNDLTELKNFSNIAKTFILQIGERFGNSLYPKNFIFGGLLGLLLLIFAGRRKSFWLPFLSSYLFAHILVVPFGGSNTPYITIGVVPAVSIFLAIAISELLGKRKIYFIAAICILVLINIFSYVEKNKSNNPDYFTSDYFLSDELDVIDYTYQRSNGHPFSISTLTAPLHINTLWSYLYNWYGYQTYGYLPSWIGRDQIGQLGNNLPKSSPETGNHFFIVEPTEAIPDEWVGYAFGEQNTISNVVEEKQFGAFKVEERKIKLAF